MVELLMTDEMAKDLAVITGWTGCITNSDTAALLIRDMAARIEDEKNAKECEIALDVNQTNEDEQSEDMVDMTRAGAMNELDHSRIRKGYVGGIVLSSNTWWFALARVIDEALNKGVSKEEIVREVGEKYVIFSKTHGSDLTNLKFFADREVWVNSFPAVKTWWIIQQVAPKWGIKVRLEIQWTSNRRSKFPGQYALLEIK